MFGGKKTLEQTGVLAGLTDIHSHILPGVDDGIKAADESLAALDAYETLGVKKVVLTPHVMEEYPNNTSASLRERFEWFRASYTGNVEISLGAEYMLDNRFGELLESDDLLPVMDNYLLIETAFMSPPLSLEERLEAIRLKGYFTVLAHPERYAYMRKEDYLRLQERGVLLQMNLLSIVGGYGKGVEKKARELLHAGAYDFVGTDIHNLQYHIHRFTHNKLGEKDCRELLRLRDKSAR